MRIETNSDKLVTRSVVETSFEPYEAAQRELIVAGCQKRA